MVEVRKKNYVSDKPVVVVDYNRGNVLQIYQIE